MPIDQTLLKAPWKIGVKHADGCVDVTTQDDAWLVRVPTTCAIDADTAKAIAYRVAAAPDLYQLVQLLGKSIEYQMRIDAKGGDDEGVRLKGLTLARVKAAIAFADGEAESADLPL